MKQPQQGGQALVSRNPAQSQPATSHTLPPRDFHRLPREDARAALLVLAKACRKGDHVRLFAQADINRPEVLNLTGIYLEDVTELLCAHGGADLAHYRAASAYLLELRKAGFFLNHPLPTDLHEELASLGLLLSTY